MSSSANYYEVLEVSPDAREPEIKQAYRRLVRKHHPDANPEHNLRAEALMKDIMEAYGTLGDPAKRARYDAESKLRAFEDRFVDAAATESTHTSSNMGSEVPASLMGKVRLILGFDSHDFAARLGLSDTALSQLEARDGIPNMPIQLRTFTNFCEQAIVREKEGGNYSLARAMETEFARKRARREAMK